MTVLTPIDAKKGTFVGLRGRRFQTCEQCGVVLKKTLKDVVSYFRFRFR